MSAFRRRLMAAQGESNVIASVPMTEFQRNTTGYAGKTICDASLTGGKSYMMSCIIYTDFSEAESTRYIRIMAPVGKKVYENVRVATGQNTYHVSVDFSATDTVTGIFQLRTIGIIGTVTITDFVVIEI